HSPPPAELWRWREGVAFAVTSLRGGKSGEDVVVPLDRLAEAIEETVEIGRRHDLQACSWGHAGDGTSTRTSSSIRATSPSWSAPAPAPRSCSQWPSASAARSRASTGSAGRSAAGSSASGARARSSCTTSRSGGAIQRARSNQEGRYSPLGERDR